MVLSFIGGFSLGITAILILLIPFYVYIVINGRKRFGKIPIDGPIFYDEVPFQLAMNPDKCEIRARQEGGVNYSSDQMSNFFKKVFIFILILVLLKFFIF